MRVLHVIDSLRRGGAETMLARLVGELRASHDDIDNAVCAIESHGADPQLVELLGDVAFVRTGATSVLDMRPALELRRRMRSVDLVHAHLHVSAVHSRLAAASLRLPHVTTLHTGAGETATDTRPWLAADWLTARLSSRLVAPSPAIATSSAGHYRMSADRFVVIPNGVAIPPRAATVGGRTVICVARLEPFKGHADLIAALPDGARLLIVGDGPEAARLGELVSARGIGDRVSLLGHRPDVPELLAQADVFCLPSRTEALPLSLLEAMGAGLACLCTDVGGVADVLADGAGLLIPAGDPVALREALTRVLDDPQLARGLGERARERAARRYSIEVVTRRHVELYRSLVSPATRMVDAG